MRVLVTGSSGFIGGHLVHALVEEGYEVAGLDVGPNATPCGGVRYVTCDILDKSSLSEAIGSLAPECVLHLAARTDLLGRHVSDYPANVQGVANVLASVAASPSVTRCIVTSSQAVCRMGHVPVSDTDYSPATAYAESKVCTETIVRERDGGGTQWCIVRPSAVWGPGMSEHYRSFVRMVSQGRYFHIGSGDVFRPFGYVGNVVYEYLRLVEAAPSALFGKTLNVSDYQPVSVRKWAEGFQRCLCAKPIHTVPVPAAKVAAKVGDMLHALGVKGFPFGSFRMDNMLTGCVLDTSDTERICGALPFSAEEGIERTVRWLEEAGVVTRRSPSGAATSGS